MMRMDIRQEPKGYSARHNRLRKGLEGGVEVDNFRKSAEVLVGFGSCVSTVGMGAAYGLGRSMCIGSRPAIGLCCKISQDRIPPCSAVLCCSNRTWRLNGTS